VHFKFLLVLQQNKGFAAFLNVVHYQHEDLPVENYHIPLFIYAPKHVAAREFNGVSSQIDGASVLLGLLNMDYVSTFFGRDLLRKKALPGRVLIGNSTLACSMAKILPS